MKETPQQLMVHAEDIRRAAEDVDISVQEFGSEIDRDTYSNLVADVDRLVRCMADLEAGVPDHWQIPGITVQR